jgi:hypothetical protein
MKNILVSKEKWEDLISFTRCFTYEDSWAKDIIAMPDFVESEEDVDVVAKELWNQMWDYHQPEEKKWENIGELVRIGKRESAQAAINALKIKGE